MRAHETASTPSTERFRLLLAFASVYLVWGSTYLAIRYAIESIAPFLMASVRFGIAGLLLVGWARRRGAALPTPAQWKTAAVVGTLLLLGGNGGVVWAEQRVPSSLAALIVAVVPLSTALLDWLRPSGQRPEGTTVLGLVTGFIGVALLVRPPAGEASHLDPLGGAVLILATLSWAAGSIYSRKAKGADSPLMAAGANMIMGGIGLGIASVLSGELPSMHFNAVSLRSLLALLYLIAFGSIVGFTAYTFLLRHTSTARATTYAYVNPVVALLLGWAIGGEPLTGRIVLAAAVIISGVIMITALPQVLSWVLARRLAAAKK